MKASNLRLRKNDAQREFFGFTLIESLFALFLLSSICMIFSISIKSTAVVTEILKSEREKEWHIFIIQLENELKNCQYKEMEANKIILRNKKNGKPVWIEHKLGKIVKVENGGYHPLLIGVKEVTFIEKNKAIAIKVIFENNLSVMTKWIITQDDEHE